MHLIITGIEYSGTTTLSFALGEWGKANLGGDAWGQNQFHDHWKLPHVSNFSPPQTDEERQALIAEHPDAARGDWSRTGLTEEEQQMILGLTPKLKEMLQRYHMEYHLHESFYGQPDHIQVGAYIEEGIYAPLYFGYGGVGEYADRRNGVRAYERQILSRAPDTVLVLVKASAEVIERRMAEWPHHNGALQRGDIASVLARFEEEYEASLLNHKVVIDTSSATVEESMEELAGKLIPLFSEADRNRMKAAKAG
jgi:hypothetical protein